MKLLLVVLIVLAAVCQNFAFFFNIFKSKNQNSVRPINDSCVEKARQGDCQFYVCFDERHPCESDDNYALKYGWRFCSRFDLYKDDLTDEGKSWLNGSRLCSMEKMLEFYRADQINCEKLEEEMRENHAECEVESGLCRGNLLVNNRDVFSDVYAINRRSATHFLMSVKQCTVSAFREASSWFQDQFHDIENFGRTSVLPFLRDLQQQMRQLKEDFREEMERIRETFRDGTDAFDLIKNNEEDDEDNSFPDTD